MSRDKKYEEEIWEKWFSINKNSTKTGGKSPIGHFHKTVSIETCDSDDCRGTLQALFWKRKALLVRIVFRAK